MVLDNFRISTQPFYASVIYFFTFQARVSIYDLLYNIYQDDAIIIATRYLLFDDFDTD